MTHLAPRHPSTPLAPTLLASALGALLLAGCSGNPTPAASVPTAEVKAVRETAAVATRDDAADDPAIWRNAANPAASLIVATDKKAGLHVYGLDGADKFFIQAGRVNNVDLLDGVMVKGQSAILVVASDRNDEKNAKLALYTLDPATAALTPLGIVAAGDGESYGLCLAQLPGSDTVHAFAAIKDGTINQIALDLGGATPTGRVVRSMKVPSQVEGCVVDTASGTLYVGEENVGVWAFSTGADAPTEGRLFAKADGAQLVADVEGLALAPGSDGRGYLVVSSQGDNAYTLYGLADGAYVGRFRIVDNGAGVDGTSETDGIALMAGDFGPDFPGGLFVAQDGDNAPQPQNFKLVSWQAVVDALGLK
ncbi:phytase [Parapedomonas caeni]